MLTFSGLAIAPNGNLYAASVLTGRIAEYDLDGNLVRLLLAPSASAPPITTGHPQGLAVSPDGTVHYADLDLVGTLPDVGPGPDGRVLAHPVRCRRRPRLPPDVVRAGLAFPDGVAVAPGDLETPEPVVPDWPTLAGSAERRFSNPVEDSLTASNADQLVERWRFPTGAVVTASPSIATVTMPSGSSTRSVFVHRRGTGSCTPSTGTTAASCGGSVVGGPTGRLVPSRRLGDGGGRRRPSHGVRGRW